MNITVKSLPNLPGPHEIGWVDDALNQIPNTTGSLVARPVATGDGLLVAFGTAGPYRLVSTMKGTSEGPARYAQFTRFDHKDAEWIAAYDRAGKARIEPAIAAVPGWVSALICRTDDGTTLVITLAESIEALQAGISAIMATELLPWEKPEHMTGPDDVQMLQLMHVDVPS